MPQDRRQALAGAIVLPDADSGAALFADISGFTPLTEALERELGARRGADVLTHHLNLVYDALIGDIERWQGSVITFSGDAITCWFADSPVADATRRAVTAALALQETMRGLATIQTPAGQTFRLALKVAVATGTVHRYQVGNPYIQRVDVLAGATLERMAAAEQLAHKSEIVVDAPTHARLANDLSVSEWRTDDARAEPFAVIANLAKPAAPAAWPPLPRPLTDAQTREWLLPAVQARLEAGQGTFLTELRPAVAMFLRFTGLDYDHDPAAGQTFDTYIQWLQSVVGTYDGALLQITVGDKGSYLNIGFGAPTAHENDAERAARAALELQQPPPELAAIGKVQIGLTYGTLRAGTYGGSHRHIYGIMGDSVNLAARLMQRAERGHILLDSSMVGRMAGVFEVEELPPAKIKGKIEPIELWRLVGLADAGAKAKFSGGYSLPMVGRQSELAQLQQRIVRAAQNTGGIVGIVGEAGMGKSRLVAESASIARAHNMAIFAGECQSYGTTNGYLVWQTIWRAIFGLSSDSSTTAQIAGLTAYVRDVDPALLPRLPLLSGLLRLPIPDTPLTAGMDAKLRKTSRESLLVECLNACARQSPVVLVLEDCHWLDPLSADLLAAIGRASRGLPVLVLMTYRPPDMEQVQRTRFVDLPQTIIALDRLPEAAARDLIERKLRQTFDDGLRPDPHLLERIVARAEGNPFYIEELLNYVRDHSLTDADLPTSLHSLILSRIDRLSEAERNTLKVASVIGRIFKAAWLWSVFAGLGAPDRVQSYLDHLTTIDLTLAEAVEPELVYLFKHAITRDVAYESLAYATRALLHEQIARFIENHLAGTSDYDLNMLAYHYGQTNNTLKQREYFRKAAEAAEAAYNNDAALAHYARLLDVALPDERGAILLRMAGIALLVGRWDDGQEWAEEAVRLADAGNDPILHAHSYHRLGEVFRHRRMYDDALRWLERARASWQKAETSDPTVRAGLAKTLMEMGQVYDNNGDYATARVILDESISIARANGDLLNLARALRILGDVGYFQADYARARQNLEGSLSIFRNIGDNVGVANTLGVLGGVAYYQKDMAAATRFLQESLALRRQTGHKQGIAAMLTELGSVAYRQEDMARARTYYEDGLRQFLELGDDFNAAVAQSNLANIYCWEGDYRQGIELHRASLLIFRDLKNGYGIGEELRNLGNALFAQEDYVQAHAAYRESMLIAVELDNKDAIMLGLNALACIIFARGKADRSTTLGVVAQLFGVVARMQVELKSDLDPLDRRNHDTVIAELMIEMGATVLAAEMAESAAMSVDEAVAIATTTTFTS